MSGREEGGTGGLKEGRRNLAIGDCRTGIGERLIPTTVSLNICTVCQLPGAGTLCCTLLERPQRSRSQGSPLKRSKRSSYDVLEVKARGCSAEDKKESQEHVVPTWFCV